MGRLVGVSEMEEMMSEDLVRLCRNVLQPLGITRALESMVSAVLLPGADSSTPGYATVHSNFHHRGWCATVLRERVGLQVPPPT